MSAPIAPPRGRRLGSLRNGSVVGLAKPSPKIPAAPKPTCCDDPKVEDDGEGHTVCRNCFTQISEANIVSDVTFQEDSRGAAAVQGGFIGENARHASTLGSAITRATGAGERNSALEVERNARRALDKFCPALGILDAVRNQAINIFSLASRSNFSAGRRTDEVAAASLYAACRRQRNNQVMLIDISELLHMNVFRLGEVYKAMCKDIHLQDNGGVGTQYLVEVESLIMKYCRKLEFGDATRQVAEDAVMIVRRMKRDWMVTGRHPAGLCGACIILAAKMNNFRRSTREVVYVAKVADITIMKRVHEFRRTQAAALTVDQFREFGNRLKHQHDPPVLYESELKKAKLVEQKRKRDASTMARESAGVEARTSLDPSRTSATPMVENEDEARRKRQRTNTGEPVTPPPTQQQQLRRDADGFAIPALPTGQTPSTQTPGPAEEAPRKRGRPKKPPPEPIVITDEELHQEELLEMDINDNLNDDEVIDSRNEIEKAKTEERSKQLADQQIQVAAEERKARREAEGITWISDEPLPPHEEATPAALEAEFANDPEVLNCLLSAPEQKVKEQIWVLHNEDWLRQQQEKKLIAAVAKATGRDGRSTKSSKITKRKRKSKMGDGSTLAEATTPIETPADANRAMVQRRNANFSKYLNWEVLEKVFEPNSSRNTSSRGSTTPNGSIRTPSTGGRGNTGDTAGSASSSPEVRAPAAAGRRVRVLSPPATQAVAGAARSETPISARPTPTPPPATPPPTQEQTGADEEVDDEYDDPNDYVQEDYDEDELDYGWGREDEREDIGEDDDDDYRSAIGRTGGVGREGEYMDDDFE